MKKIHTNDTVLIIAWKFSWSTGKVLSISNDQVYVEWINVLQSKKKGSKHHSIHISNVSYYDTNQQKKINVGIKSNNGKNVRFDKKTGEVL